MPQSVIFGWKNTGDTRYFFKNPRMLQTDNMQLKKLLDILYTQLLKMVWKHLFLASWIFVSFSKSIKRCLLPGLRGGWVPLLIFCLWCPYQKYLQKYLNHDTLACFSTTESLEQLRNYYLSQKLSNCFLFILFLFWIDKTKFVFPQSQIYKLIKYISLHVKERIQFDSITNIR